MFNFVEALAEEEEQGETPCAWGNLVEGHSVYCHNDDWLEGPRKCRRTWYTGGEDPEDRDEACPGFKANPTFPGGSEQWIQLRRKKAEERQASPSESPGESK
jgi:hypothetical protein